jgi:hypothetical protein
MTSRLEMALEFAAQGFAVFELAPNSKRPRHTAGVYGATTDPDAIRAIFERNPDANYGVTAGPNGVILDLDNKESRNAAGDIVHRDGARDLIQAFQMLPVSRTVATPNDGLHIYLSGQINGGPVGGAPIPGCPGVDVKGLGGYVVGPGSIIDGRAYTIVDPRPIGKIPRSLAPHLHPPRTRTHDDGEPLGELDSEAAIARAVDFLQSGAAEPGRPGHRDIPAFHTACVLKDFGLSESMVADVMTEHWDCVLDDHFGVDDIAEKARRAFISGADRPGIKDAANHFDAEAIKSALDGFFGEPGADTAQDDLTLRERANATFTKMDVTVTMADLKPLPWIVKDMLLPGHVTIFASPPGIGKSSMLLGISAACALGDGSFLGIDVVNGRKKTLLLTTEEDKQMRDARFASLCEHHGLNGLAMDNYLHTQATDDMDLKFVKREGRHKLVATDQFRRLEAYCLEHRIDTVVIDPWVESHEADENNNAEMAEVTGIFRGLCRRRGIAGVIVHHTVKSASADRAGDAGLVRGGGSQNGSVRYTYTMLRPSQDEAAALGMDEDEAAAVFRLDKGKGSYSKPGKATRYYRTVGLIAPSGAEGSCVEMLDSDNRRALTAQHLADLLIQAMDGSVQDEAAKFKLPEAVGIVRGDPVFGAMSEAGCKELLRTTFEGAGVVLDGLHIRFKQFGSARMLTVEPSPGEIAGDIMDGDSAQA